MMYSLASEKTCMKFIGSPSTRTEKRHRYCTEGGENQGDGCSWSELATNCGIENYRQSVDIL